MSQQVMLDEVWLVLHLPGLAGPHQLVARCGIDFLTNVHDLPGPLLTVGPEDQLEGRSVRRCPVCFRSAGSGG